MGRVEGEGAENLDYSSYTYEQLRSAVYGVNADSVRVAANEWADLRRRLNERVGTLRVEIVKLGPAWDSPAGQQALKTLADQRDWMAEFARVASWNEERMTDVQDAYYKAIKAMRALDAEPDRPNPGPGQSPGSGTTTDPAASNWKQPHAVKIANYLYSNLAIAAATMAMPPSQPKDDPSSYGKDGVPGEGPALPPTVTAPNSRSHSGAEQDGSSASKSGGPPGLVIRNPTPGRTPSPPDGRASATGPATGTKPSKSPGMVSGPTAHDRSATSAPTQVPRSGRGGVPSAGQASSGKPGFGRVITSPWGTGQGGGPPAVTDSGTKTLGGGLRPPLGTPAGPGPGQVPPGGMVHPGGAAGHGGRAGKKKPGYERGEPDTFRDSRHGNAAGGEVRNSERRSAFDPLPGMLGTQRHQAGEQRRQPWEVPEPAPLPAGFPEELRDFKHSDGTQFQVRRRGNAV